MAGLGKGQKRLLRWDRGEKSKEFGKNRGKKAGLMIFPQLFVGQGRTGLGLQDTVGWREAPLLSHGGMKRRGRVGTLLKGNPCS